MQYFIYIIAFNNVEYGKNAEAAELCEFGLSLFAKSTMADHRKLTFLLYTTLSEAYSNLGKRMKAVVYRKKADRLQTYLKEHYVDIK